MKMTLLEALDRLLLAQQTRRLIIATWFIAGVIGLAIWAAFQAGLITSLMGVAEPRPTGVGIVLMLAVLAVLLVGLLISTNVTLNHRFWKQKALEQFRLVRFGATQYVYYALNNQTLEKVTVDKHVDTLTTAGCVMERIDTTNRFKAKFSPKYKHRDICFIWSVEGYFDIGGDKLCSTDYQALTTEFLLDRSSRTFRERFENEIETVVAAACGQYFDVEEDGQLNFAGRQILLTAVEGVIREWQEHGLVDTVVVTVSEQQDVHAAWSENIRLVREKTVEEKFKEVVSN